MVSIKVKDGNAQVNIGGMRNTCLAEMNAMFKVLIEKYAEVRGITNGKSVIELMQTYMSFGINMSSDNEMSEEKKKMIRQWLQGHTDDIIRQFVEKFAEEDEDESDN